MQFSGTFISPGGTFQGALFSIFSYTNLTSNLTSGATTITFSSAPNGFNNQDYILIDSEWLQITAGGGTATWTVTRGVASQQPTYPTSPAASHSSGASVRDFSTFALVAETPAPPPQQVGAPPTASNWSGPPLPALQFSYGTGAFGFPTSTAVYQTISVWLIAESIDTSGVRDPVLAYLTPATDSQLNLVLPAVAAPNVTGPSSGSPCAAFYEDANGVVQANPSVGGVYGVRGTITLPISDPNYAQLRQIQVYLWLPGATSRPSYPVSTMLAPFPGLSGDQLNWSNPNLGPTIPTTRTFPEVEFVVSNSSNIASNSPFTFNNGGAGITVLGTTWNAVDTAVNITVQYRAPVGGDYQFQVSGSFTPPTDAAYSCTTAQLEPHGVTSPPGEPLATNAINSWTGPWITLEATTFAADVILIAVNLNNQDSSVPVIITPTMFPALNISQAAAQAYVNGGSTTTGVEIPNCTFSSVSVVYSANRSADGWSNSRSSVTAPRPPTRGSRAGR